MTYRYNAYATGRTREELERAARAEAEGYFGSAELTFLGADVSTETKGSTLIRYGGTFSFELKEPANL